MKYFAKIENNKIAYIVTDERNHVIKQLQNNADLKEITEEQADNRKFCTVVNGEIVFDKTKSDKEKNKKEKVKKRLKGFGSPESQLDEIEVDGLDAWRARRQAVRTANPLPE